MLAGVTRATTPPPPVTLVSGSDSFLAERAVADVLSRARHADPEVDVSTVQAVETGAAGLAEMLSPSLFAATRVAVIDGLDQASEDLAAELARLAADPPDGAVLVLVHLAGSKGKRLLDALRRSGVVEVRCDPLKRAEDVLDFVLGEARDQRGRIERAAATRLVEVLGNDLRTLASMTEQLVADSDGTVTVDLIEQYVGGRAEVKGWAVADLAVTGQSERALAELGWAMASGTDPVLVVGALAASLRTLARLSAVPRGYRDTDVARDLGVPSWKVRVLRGQLRGWSASGLAQALRAVASADLAIKGASFDPALALSATVLAIGEARAGH